MPSTKKTLIVIMMLIISLLLISQFSSTKLFKGEPAKEKGSNPTSLPESYTRSTNKTLRIEVNVTPLVYSKLKELCERYTEEYGTKVELINRDAKPDVDQLVEQYQLNQNADVLLVNSEDVKRLAVKGMLLPNEQAAKGLDAGTDWITEYIRWNGLTWAVPAYLDPYVMVWNTQKLKEQTGLDRFPENGVQLRNILSRMTQEQNSEQLKGEATAPEQEQSSMAQADQEDAEVDPAIPADRASAWFVWDEDDSYALLSLMWRLGIVAPNEKYIEPSDPLQGEQQDMNQEAATKEIEPWLQTIGEWTIYRELFLPLSGAERSRLWDGLELGHYLFAIVPYSEAVLNQKTPLAIEEPKGVSSPIIQWVRSSSYVIAANTEMEAEAVSWITYISESAVQLDLMEAVSLLPADRTAYEQTWPLMSSRIPSMFSQGNDGLRAALQRTLGLEAWSKMALEWFKSNEAETKLIEEWQRLWDEPPA